MNELWSALCVQSGVGHWTVSKRREVAQYSKGNKKTDNFSAESAGFGQRIV